MVAESAGEKLINPPCGGRVTAPAATGPRARTLSTSGPGRSRADRCYHTAVLRYLQDLPVLNPGQVLAGVVAQLTDSDYHG